MFCKYCGNILPDWARRCPSCGAVLDKSSRSRLNEDCDHKHRTELSFDSDSRESGGSFLADAVLSYLRGYVDFGGRASRKEYWVCIGLLCLLNLVLGLVWEDAAFILQLLTLLPTLAITARRLRDCGKGPRWLFALLIPLVGGITVLLFCLAPSADAK